ncbi:MAG: NAD(P)H-hydrate epimerase [Gammaproteobacteria bacterium]|nr:NAD(P)H-hydrate epimerase [Gammaproteobacteria bacterium]|tara:strand:+ start:846 stop:1535 length:690 start_codon:yes stop_codon:yes gene_type:complete
MTEHQYYTAAQTQKLDRLAIEKHGIPGFDLMQRAGKAAFSALKTKWPFCRNLIIFCGTGNNGGDGFIVGTLAKISGMNATVYLAGSEENISGDARLALDQAKDNEVNIKPVSEFSNIRETPAAADSTVIIDALLGTGLKGDVREPYSDIIHEINVSALPVLAIDIPSGLCSDTGAILGNAVKADLTVTFIGRKVGQINAQGPEYCGELVFDSLDVPEIIYAELQNDAST